MKNITILLETINFLFLVFGTTENGTYILEKVRLPLADLIWIYHQEPNPLRCFSDTFAFQLRSQTFLS